MKRVGLIYRTVMVCLIFSSLLSGCLSVPDSPSPRFYLLQAIDNTQASQKFDIAPGMIIAIGPVKIPEYQNRPQIVTQNKDKTLNFAQFDRWGEPLDVGIARLMIEDLAPMLPAAGIEMFPYNFAIPVRYQVILNVLQLDSELAKEMVFVVQWSIIDLENKQMMLMKKSQFRQPIGPPNYAGLAKALSAACASLSSEIAESLAAQLNQPEKKEAVVP